MKNTKKFIETGADSCVEAHSQLTTKSVHSIMREQSVEPPLRVWNKIEAALDAQEIKRKARKMVQKKDGTKSKKSCYLEFAAAVCIIAGLIHFK